MENTTVETTQATVEVGTIVNFKSKKVDRTGKVIKIYQENDKTYYKINENNKYYFKQLKDIQTCNS